MWALQAVVFYVKIYMSNLKKQLLISNEKGPQKGSFLMKELSMEEFWTNDYVRKLNYRGKLALIYVLSIHNDNDEIIIEDMSLDTKLDASECRNWLTVFSKDKVIMLSDYEYGGLQV